jgi:hypothetical protein
VEATVKEIRFDNGSRLDQQLGQGEQIMSTQCRAIRGLLGATLLCVVLWAVPVSAQTAVVTTYYPAQPVVSYVPEARGLLGLRTVYRPVVSYATPAVTSVVPAAPVTAYYAPVAAPVTAYYAPVAAPAPVSTYYAPAAAPEVTSYYAPAAAAPVTTYRVVTPAPAAVAPVPVTTYYAPAPVVNYRPVIVPY